MQLHNVIVYDFDSLVQAQDWLRHPQTAKKEFLAKLRTAILLSGNLTLFYANIFDGILFLQFTPQELAEQLGCLPSEPLPFTVYGPSTQVAPLYEAVQALGANSCRLAYGLQVQDLDWLYPSHQPANNPAPQDFESWYQARVALWLQAIETGRLSLKSWRQAHFPMQQVLQKAVQSIQSLPESTHHLILTLCLAQEVQDDNSICQAHQALQGSSKIQLALSKLRIPQDVIAKRLRALQLIHRLGTTPQEKLVVFTWWNAAYTRTIARLYQADYINFGSFLTDNERRDQEMMTPLGLSPKRHHVLTRYFRPLESSSLVITGSILSDMTKLSAFNYAQLRINAREFFQAQTRPLNPNSMRDLALMVGDSLPEFQSFNRKRLIVYSKFLLIAILATLSVLYELNVLENGSWLGIATICLLAVPWDELQDLLAIHQTQSASQLTFMEDLI